MGHELINLYVNVLKYGHSVVEVECRPNGSYWVWMKSEFGRSINVLLPTRYVLGEVNDE